MGHGATVPQASGSVCPNASAPGSGCTPGPLHSPRPTLNGCYWRNLGASWSTSPLFFHTIWVTLAFGAWPSGGPGAPLEQPPELGLGQGRAQLPQPPAIVSDNVRTSPWGRAPLHPARSQPCPELCLAPSPDCVPSVSPGHPLLVSAWRRGAVPVGLGGPSGSSPKPPALLRVRSRSGLPEAPEPSGCSRMLGLAVPSGDRGHGGREEPPPG